MGLKRFDGRYRVKHAPSSPPGLETSRTQASSTKFPVPRPSIRSRSGWPEIRREQHPSISNIFRSHLVCKHRSEVRYFCADVSADSFVVDPVGVVSCPAKGARARRGRFASDLGAATAWSNCLGAPTIPAHDQREPRMRKSSTRQYQPAIHT